MRGHIYTDIAFAYSHWQEYLTVFVRSALEFIPGGKYLDIPTLMMNLKKAGKTVLTFCSECKRLDIGRPDDYEQAVIEFERSRSNNLRDTH
jgi:hypothetical protein